MTDSSYPRVPETFEGMRVGQLRRSAGRLAVYAATDRLDLAVELHVVLAAALPPEFPAEAFVSILRRAADVRHESLLTYSTGGRAGEFLFAVAKAQAAPGLDEVLARGGGVAEDRAAAIGLALTAVLTALERAGMRHGDITPRRVLLPGRGQVLLGPPRIVPASAAPRNERYQSPEEARGEIGDVRSDLFVVGLVVAEALRGEPVLKGPGGAAAKAIAQGDVPADGGVQMVGPAIRSILFRLLATDPARRFPTAAAAEQAFQRMVGGTSPSPEMAPFAPLPPAPAPAPVFAHDQAPPETAPIDLAALRNDMAAALARPAPPPAATAPAAQPARIAEIDPELIRRSPGRLYLEGRLGETLLEIDETLYVGKPAGNLDIVARPDLFPEAEFRIERQVESDVVVRIGPPLQVNGAATADKVLANGDIVSGPTMRGRYERDARVALVAAAAGPPVGAGKARALLAVAVGVAVFSAVVAWSRLGTPRAAADRADAVRLAAVRSRDQALAAANGGAPAGPADPKEKAALDAYDTAREWIRKHGGDTEGAAEKLSAVANAHEGTGHGALARAEAAEFERRARASGTSGGGELDALFASTRKDAALGKLDQAILALRAFAESHPSTVAAERARIHAVTLEAEILGKYEADMARVNSLVAKEEPDAALRLISRIMDYVPDSLRQRTIDRRREIETGAAGTPKDPVKPPTVPPTGPPPVPPTVPPTTEKPDPSPEAPKGPATPEDKEKAAESAFRAARRLMDSSKEVEALDLFLAFLKEHKGTKTAAKYDNEVRARIQTLAQSSAGIVRLFRGKVEAIEKGRYRITYDFEDPEQAKDFRDDEAFEAPPRANWKLEGGVVRAPRGSGAYVLDATFAVDSLTATAKVSPDRPHDLGIAFVDGNEPRRFYLFMLQNTFFSLGKGPSAQVFRENAIVLFGPGMWRDTPPGQIGFVRKCGSPDPEIRGAEWTELRCAKVDGNVWMKFDGKNQIQGSAYGDIKLEFQGLQPAFFVLNSSGVFDALVVEGTPDPDWVKERWRAILSGL